MPAVTHRSREFRVPDLETLDDNSLLDMRFCDLPVRLEGGLLARRVVRLHRELQARSIVALPHAWLSEEFFTPDGVPGFAIPFYLAHPRLMRLERKKMFEVEGGTEQELMRILRHETGHALDNAYRIHIKESWRKTFGSVKQRY